MYAFYYCWSWSIHNNGDMEIGDGVFVVLSCIAKGHCHLLRIISHFTRSHSHTYTYVIYLLLYLVNEKDSTNKKFREDDEGSEVYIDWILPTLFFHISTYIFTNYEGKQWMGQRAQAQTKQAFVRKSRVKSQVQVHVRP